MKHSKPYPFSALVGQDLLKKGLIINLVNPKVGGLLISGEKGTGKSTIIRGLKNLTDNMEIIELPLNTTLDGLTGSINVERAILEGKKVIGNSILMRANGNILYADEVNLLRDEIVNVLLEVSQSGTNHVEREGISVSHESSFVLIGTMNPEEGDLRPQLLDRFGFYIDIKGERELTSRVEVIKRRMEYENNFSEFIEEWKDQDNKIKEQIDRARKIIDKVDLPEDIIKFAAEIALKANCSGHRAELVMVEGAKALAALDNRLILSIEDLEEAAKLALPHRMRQIPPSPPNNGDEEENESGRQEENQGNDRENKDEDERENNSIDGKDKDQHTQGINEDMVDEIGEIFKIRDLEIKPLDRRSRKGSGRRSQVKTRELQGQYVRYKIPKGKINDIAFDATIRVAAPYQKYRNKRGKALAIENSDMRQKVREKRRGSSILFVVDASGSMGAKKRMEAVKGAIISLLTDAYEKRDSVGMLAFRKDDTELVLNITRSVDLAYKRLKDLPTGGKTPLALGLYRGYELLKLAMKKDPDIIPVLVLISDGRGNISSFGKRPLDEALEISEKIALEGIQSIVVDTEMDFIKLHQSKTIAEALGGKYYSLNELKAEEIITAIKQSIV